MIGSYKYSSRVAWLLFHATPTNSLKWSYAHNGNDFRSSSSAFPSFRTQPDSSYTQFTFALKDVPNPDLLARYGTQVYGVASYDSLFKWILDDPDVLPSFFRALVPGINVTSPERLGENMNPLQEFQLLRTFDNNNDTQKTVVRLKGSGFEVRIKKNNQTYQYPLAIMRQNTLTDEQRDWLIFLRDGDKKTEADVEQIKTPSVRRAFERAKLNRLTQAQLEAYENEDVKFRRISGLLKDVTEEAEAKGIAEGIAKGIAEGIAKVKAEKIALKMLIGKLDDETIIECTDLTSEELAELKQSLKK